VAQDLIDRIHWWENYTALFGASIDNTPHQGISWADWGRRSSKNRLGGAIVKARKLSTSI
jgi:hypothetical protein